MESTPWINASLTLVPSLSVAVIQATQVQRHNAANLRDEGGQSSCVLPNNHLAQAALPSVTDNYTIKTIELPVGSVNAWFVVMNERGLVGVQYFLPDSTGQGHTAILENGVWKNIDVPGSVWCGGSWPSSSGRIGLTCDLGDGVMRTAIYHKGTYTYLPDHPTYPYCINALTDRDLMTGGAWDSSGFMHGLLLNSSLGTFEVFDPPFDQDIWYTVSFGINNAGVNVGYTEGEGFCHSYIYDGQTFSKVVVPEVQDYTAAESINNHGEIAGWYADLDWTTRGFLLRQGQFSDFFVPGSLGTAIDTITDRGQLSGRYVVYVDGAYILYGFVATPKATK